MSINALYAIMRKEDWNLKEIEKFIEQDPSLRCKENEGLALFFAVRHCHPDVIRLVLKYDASINRRSAADSNCTPLIAALQCSRDASVIRILLENGADVNMLFGGGSRRLNALCIALKSGTSKDVVQLLLDAGHPLDGCHFHRTAFHCAIGDAIPSLKQDILQLLRERGADANASNFNDQAVMCYALWMGAEARFIQMLLNVGSSLSACVKHTSPMICLTSMLFRPLAASVVKLLLDNGSPKDVLHVNGLTPLQCVLKSAEYETGAIRLLLEGLPDVDVVDGSKNNLLNLAVGNLYCFQPDVASLLIKRGVHADMRNRDGRAPLHLAAMRDKCGPSVLKLLLQNGATLQQMDINRKTPVMLAMECSQPMSKIRVLLASGTHIGVLYRSAERYIDEYLYGEECCNRGLKYEYFKILAKYALLSDPRFEVDFYPNMNMKILLQTPEDRAFVRKFTNECLEEVQRMARLYVSRRLTLRDFIATYSAFQKEVVSRPIVRFYDCNLLLRIKADDEFPLYKEIIWDKVDRAVMYEALLNIQIYSVSGDKIIVLKYHHFLDVIEYLEDDCLFRLITAFNNKDAEAASSRKLGMKRISNEAGNVRKKLRQLKTRSALQ